MIISTSSNAATKLTAERAEARFKEIFSSINHLTVDFEQIVYKDLRKRKTHRSGSAFFSKPYSFRWNFNNKSRGREIFYFNGKILSHFQESEKLVTHYRANSGIARDLTDIVQLVLDPSKLFNRYHITRANLTGSSKEEVLEAQLEPRAALAIDIEAIHVKASIEKHYIQDIKIVYMNKNYTRFKFSAPRFNPNRRNLFHFSEKGDFTVRTRN